MGRSRIVLDSGAVSALAGRDEVVRSFLRKAIEEDAEIAVPTVVIAKSTTGTARDAEINRVMRALEPFVVTLTEPIAREAGSLRFRAGRPLRDTIDAIVVATSDAFGSCTILTGDPTDLRALANVEGRSHVVALARR